MKNRFAIKSVVLTAAVTLTAASTVIVFADQTDVIEAVIPQTCIFAREAYTSGGVTNNSSHKDGADGAWSTTVGENQLNTTRTNGSVTTDLGTSQFKVVCNDIGGYTVTVDVEDLTSGSLTIPANTTYSSSVSGWSPIVNSVKMANGGTVKTESSVTSGTVFEVGYGVGISDTQAAGTYTGTATYRLTTSL